MTTLEAIKFDRTNVTLQILDQLLIPYSTEYLNIEGVDDAYDAIKSMQVRGAPAIAIVGSFAIVVEIKNRHISSIDELAAKIDYLESSRPTAVNLSNACNEIRALLGNSESLDEVYKRVFDFAVALYDDDLSNNHKIGLNGVDYLVESLRSQNFEGPFSIITYCNTGSLATSGHGTALGIVRSAYKALSKENSKEKFWLEQIYPCETRPYNQGAKLTTFELKYEKIPFTLICDNMVTSLISRTHNKKQVKDIVAPVKFAIVGADRIVQNGDTANKIGTFQLAAIFDSFNRRNTGPRDSLKMIVAAPRTTIDLKTTTGDDIIIEERPANELTTLKGPILRKDVAGEKQIVGVATPGIQVWNPAFDVTPHELIDSIVTEEKVYTKDKEGNYHL